MEDRTKERISHVPTHQSSSFEEDKQFILKNYNSKEEFVKAYRKINFKEAKAVELYVLILTEIKKAVISGNVGSVKTLSDYIQYISEVDDKVTLKNYYDNANNPVKNTNLVILACKSNKVKVLEYLFHSDCKILSNLSLSDARETYVLPDEKDETCHNAFYYAVRSGNVELLDTLINKWPNNHFSDHIWELNKLLSEAYEELKLNNVLLSEEMEVFVEYNLLSLCFLSNDTLQDQNENVNVNIVRKQIELVLENISLLREEHLTSTKVDEKFLFVSKCIAQNMHMLKQQLKSTYNILPWEEIAFCLDSFVSSHTQQQEMNLFYLTTLSKEKVINHLQNFAKIVEHVKDNVEDICKFNNLPQLSRDEAVAEIIRNHPPFEELYANYQHIKDIHTLGKINDYIMLALSADPGQKEGQLIIIRVLQVVGKYFKNTLESPMLSSTTSRLLLLPLPSNTRDVIVDISDSLSKRVDIQESSDANFFIGIQSDTKKIGEVVSGFLYDRKVEIIRTLLQKIVDCEKIDEIKDVTEVISKTKLDEVKLEGRVTMERERFYKLITELDKSIKVKTIIEEELFSKLSESVSSEGIQSSNEITGYVTGFKFLRSLTLGFWDSKINTNLIREIKFYAQQTLQHIVTPTKDDSFKKRVELLLYCIWSRITEHNFNNLSRLLYDIICSAGFGSECIKWIEELRERLKSKGTINPIQTQNNAYNGTEEKSNHQLPLSTDNLVESNYSIKRNKTFQAQVEMLVLDMISIKGNFKNISKNNLLFLHNNTTTVLTEKCLRNHLAKDNAVVNVLQSDSPLSVVFNGNRLTSENIIKSKENCCNLPKNTSFTFEDRYNQGLITIHNQEKMFIALEEGNLEDFKSSILSGADIKGRSINGSTALHFAAKGSNIQIIKYLLSENLDTNVKNIDGQSPLHIAAACGTAKTVRYFIKVVGLHVDDQDNVGKTPLHIAAKNGHQEIVKALLEYGVNTIIHNKSACPPLHYAIRNNHLGVTKLLLEKEVNVDSSEIVGGFTPLHTAAESGHLDLVNYLLQNSANVNAKNDKGWTPLQAAVSNGHLEVVETLILNGASISDSAINGCTSLHYAIEYGHERIVNLLLKHGAKVNDVDKMYNTPLHYAAKYGHERIVEVLLKNKANPKATSGYDMTPLHLAAQSGSLEVSTVLLKHGVDIQAKDKNKATPLYYAAENGHKKTVELLIKNGAEVNARSNNNFSPLHKAASNGHLDVCDFLIRNKARVNARDMEGSTPLHLAVMNGGKDIIDLLMRHKAEVNTRTNVGVTPLHSAAMFGYNNVVVSLIEHKAQVNAKAMCDLTPLHVAVIASQKYIVKDLIQNKANVNAETSHNKLTPLMLAIYGNDKEITETLLAVGANVYGKGKISPLGLAVSAGHKDIVQMLLNNKACVNVKDDKNYSYLHLAAEKGHKEIVNALIAEGADVNAITIDNTTPLFLAAQEGHGNVVEVLIANGANVYIGDCEYTPLHVAAGRGHIDVVKVLLNNGVQLGAKDKMSRTPLELAVGQGHLQVVKTLLENETDDVMNAKCNDDCTLLHIASQNDNLEMVEFLVSKGSNINAKNATGLKPIHIAAREGQKDIVQFFLSKGLSANELCSAKQTLLHYAAMRGQLQVAEYLVAQGADVNVKDINRLTPMNVAAESGCKDIVELLLRNGAVYNSAQDMSRVKPSEITNNNKVVASVLATTDKLFHAVKKNSLSDVVNCIKAGAFVNAKNATSGTPLHYAAWKGYNQIVKILLQNKANPNLVDGKGFTPIHYAAKFSHLNIVQCLLTSGAVHNAVSDHGKTPVDLAVDRNITNLFNLISESFKKVIKGDTQVINDLNKLKDIDTVKAVMSARNLENNSLVVVGILSNFAEIESLKQVWQSGISNQISTGIEIYNQGNYPKALNIFQSLFEKRKEILGPDNPGTLDIQTHVARILYAQGFYEKALELYEDIFQKQTEIFGLNNMDALKTKNTIALILHRQGKDDQALAIYEEIYQKQKETLGPNHSDTLDSWFHMAVVLISQEKYEEALRINKAVYEQRKIKLGTNDPFTISTQNNIAMVLSNLGEYEEALEIFEDVLEKKRKVLGVNHILTMRTMCQMAELLNSQKKYPEALKALQEVFNMQKNALGSNHPETLSTRYKMTNILFAQGKWIGALKAYRDVFVPLKAALGPSHPAVTDIFNKIQMINMRFQFEGVNETDVLEFLDKDINVVASNGDLQTLQFLLKNGVDANDRDGDGRTPLHFAVSNGHIPIVNLLLKSGADAFSITNKGNTPLHTAASKGCTEIVEILLQHISRDKLNNFVNAKTVSNGTTAVHVAAKGGSLETVQSLLKHGATYNIKNKERKTPISLSKDKKVSQFLKFVEEIFENAKKGSLEIIDKLSVLKQHEFLAVTRTRKNQGKTLSQIAIANGHKNIASKLLEMIKLQDQYK